MPRRPEQPNVPPSAVAELIEPWRVDALLERWLPEPEGRAFVVRCIIGEGPAHHRGANYTLLRLLGEALALAEGGVRGEGRSVPRGVEPPTRAVPMRLPPHHAAREGAAKSYPLRLPTRAIERLHPEGTRPFEAMVDCLVDGPPQHALANVAMLTLLDALLARLDEGSG